MPQIMVIADRPSDRGEGPVMLRERVNAADFESDHFATMLVERLGWAVSDALAAEHGAEAPATAAEHGAEASATAPEHGAEAPATEEPISTDEPVASDQHPVTRERAYRRSASVVTTAS